MRGRLRSLCSIRGLLRLLPKSARSELGGLEVQVMPVSEMQRLHRPRILSSFRELLAHLLLLLLVQLRLLAQ